MAAAPPRPSSEESRPRRYVDATFVAKTQRDYFVQMDRQAVNVACAVARARSAGVDWLLHIDDDEVLHCPAGVGALWAALRAAPRGCCDAHLKNVEALAPDASCARPFAECTTFVASTSKFSSYTNGKSFGRVAAPGLRLRPRGHSRCLHCTQRGAGVVPYASSTFWRRSRPA